MAQIRRQAEQSHFTILANGILVDPRLSFRALGLLVRLLSEPPNSTINTASLQDERCKEGRDAIRKALVELEAAGYLTRPRRQGPRGRWRTDWIVSSVPELPEEITTPIPVPKAPALYTHPDSPLLVAACPVPAWPITEPDETCGQLG